MARMAEVLSEEMKDCSIITRRNGHFITLLPETDRGEAHELMDTLKMAAKEKLGVDLRMGLSCFPDDEITFVHLLERAEDDMNGTAVSDSREDLTERLTSESNSTLSLQPVASRDFAGR